MKRAFVLDSEIFKNYFLIGFMDIATDKVWSVEAVGENSTLSKEDRLWLRDWMRRFTIGFNSKGFDLPIIYAAIAGRTVGELKKIANDIIQGGMKPWDVEREWGIEIPKLDHIDLIEPAPGAGSLKIFNGRLHGKRMQDLPIHHDAVLSTDEIEIVFDYWKNDLQATKLLFNSLSAHLDLREALSRQYKIDLRSKSDAQVAEAIIKHEIEKINGERLGKGEKGGSRTFKYEAPDYIRYRDPLLIDIVEKLEDWTFRVGSSGKVEMPPFLSETPIPIGNSVYSMGIGGLHSTEERVKHVADDEYDLTDHDVESFYPRIITSLGLYPERLGKVFLKVYKTIIARRLSAKHRQKEIENEIKALKVQMTQTNGPSDLMQEKLDALTAEHRVQKVQNEGGKIQINGSFGKLGSMFSILFAPKLLLTVTLTGQLSLLMLIHRLEREGISVVSGNTDGIVVRCHKSKLARKAEIIAQWEADTDFKTEAAQYRALYAASVNNYFALKVGGGAKRKGHYAKSGLDEKKNPTEDICADAVAEFLDNGTPIGKTIRECRDIRKFVTVRNVTGGAIYGVKEVSFERISEKTGKVLKPGTKYDSSDAVYLGKAVRFYRSTQSIGALHYKDSLNKVPKSDGCKPLMELPDSFPMDVDFSSYIKAARQMLYDIAYYEEL